MYYIFCEYPSTLFKIPNLYKILQKHICIVNFTNFTKIHRNENSKFSRILLEHISNTSRTHPEHISNTPQTEKYSIDYKPPFPPIQREKNNTLLPK